MAAGQKLYPRATLKKIVKAHSRKNVSKNADVLVSYATAAKLVFLDYALFLQTLMKEAGINAKQAGDRGITAKNVKKVTEALDASQIQGLRSSTRRKHTSWKRRGGA
ncbi:hypothetical protein ACLOAV_002794 [Pseudogymnoascus australis]